MSGKKKSRALSCPRCGREVTLPQAEQEALSLVGFDRPSSVRFRLCPKCLKEGLKVPRLGDDLDALVRLLVAEATWGGRGVDLESAIGMILRRVIRLSRPMLGVLRKVALEQMDSDQRAGMPWEKAARAWVRLGLVKSPAAARQAVSAKRRKKGVRKSKIG